MNLAEKLWDLANLVTGFAVAQSLTVTYGLATRKLQMPGRSAHRIAYTGTVVFTVSYITAVLLCGIKGQSLDATANANVWCWVTVGRVLTILMFAGVTMGTIYGHRRDERKSKL